MKVLFIEALGQGSFINSVYPPLGLYYIESYTRKYAGFPVEFFILSGGLTELKFLMSTADIGKDKNQIRMDDMDIIGISSVTANFSLAEKMGTKIKIKLKELRKEIPLLLGGCHISSLPSSLPPSFDAGVVGEGEQTFLEIITLLKKKRESDNGAGLTPADFYSIPGLVFRDGEKLLYSPPRPLIENLDIIPPPRRLSGGLPITHIMTSRGCPYSCVYCATRSMWKKVRTHSPQYVVEEIKDLYNKGIREIIIFDDNFIADKGRVKEIVELMKAEKIAGKIDFIVFGRTKGINGELVCKLKSMGVKEIYLGADTGKGDLLKENREEDKEENREEKEREKDKDQEGKKVDKKWKESVIADLHIQTSPSHSPTGFRPPTSALQTDSQTDFPLLTSKPGVWDMNQRALDLCYEAGFRINCSFVIGLPRQEEEDMKRIREFMEFNREKVSVWQISPVNLFPGTPLWEYGVGKEKIRLPVQDWSLLENFTHISQFDPERYIFLSEKVSPEMFEEYCKRFSLTV